MSHPAGVLVALVAFVPSLLLLAFFYSADRYEPEPRGHVVAAVAMGAVAMAVATLAVGQLTDAVGWEGLPLTRGGRRLLEAFVLEGLVEELAKWGLLGGVIYRWREFDEPLDGLIYGVALALGFGTVENLAYVGQGGLEVGLLRAVFAVPEHALLGATMGGFLGRAKLGGEAPRRRRAWIAGSLVVPVLLHGGYNLLLLSLVGPVMYIAVGAGSLLLWIDVLRRVRHARDASPFKPR